MIYNISITLKSVLMSLCSQSSPPTHQSSAATNLLSDTIVLPFLKSHINGTMQYAVFCVWLLLLSIRLLRFIHVVA